MCIVHSMQLRDNQIVVARRRRQTKELEQGKGSMWENVRWVHGMAYIFNRHARVLNYLNLIEDVYAVGFEEDAH